MALLPAPWPHPGAWFAHVKWYVDDPQRAPLDARLLGEPLTLALLAGTILAAALWAVVGRRVPAPEIGALRPLGRLAPWVPRLLGVHLGVSLLALAVTNAYLAPHLSLDDVPGGSALALAQGVVGVWLVSGVWLRPAALGVVALGPLALVFTGPLAVVEAVDTLGVALFLALLPPGRDRFGARHASAAQVRDPLLVLRLGAGLALVVLAFSEKLLVPELPARLLAAYPEVEVFRILGLEFSPDAYARLAGLTELFLGLVLLSGAAPQVAVLVAAVPFNLTLLVFDRFELLGHLPVYGTLLALLVYGSSPALAPAVRHLTPARAGPPAGGARRA